MSQIDGAVSGILSLSVAGSSNVVLTVTSGATSQSLNQRFNFTGILGASIYVLWPSGLNRFFSVINSTTGAFTLTCAVNNGSGMPVGTGVVVPEGTSALLYSDGTNVVQQFNSIGVTLGVSGGGTGATTLTAHGVLIGEGTSAVTAVALSDGQILVGQTSADPLAKTVSGDVTLADTGVITIANGAVTSAKIAVTTVNTQSGTTYTIQASDNNCVLLFTSSSAVTVTLPNSLAAGFSCLCMQISTGQVGFSAASGASLNNAHSQTHTFGQYSMVALVVEANSGSAAAWILGGDTT